MDHCVKFRPRELKLRHRPLHHQGQPRRKRHDVLLEVAFPNSESRHRLGQIQPLDRLAQMHFGPNAFDGIARKLCGDARHAQLFSAGTGHLASIDCERSQHRVS